MLIIKRLLHNLPLGILSSLHNFQDGVEKNIVEAHYKLLITYSQGSEGKSKFMYKKKKKQHISAQPNSLIFRRDA